MARPQNLTRAIDTLQRLYAVVGGLAITEAIKRSFLKGPNGYLQVHWSDGEIPLAFACLVTVIPFVHGMNRHLDKHSAQLTGHPRRRRMVAILVSDFAVFMLQCAMLVMLAGAVSDVHAAAGDRPNNFLNIFIGLLFIDVLWSAISEKLEKDTYRWQWLLVNVITIPILWIASQLPLPADALYWLVAAIAIGRTAADYRVNVDEYFPAAEDAEAVSG